MGKAILIILSSSLILFSVLSSSTNNVLGQATIKSVEHHTQIRARNIANSMVQLAKSKLSDDNGWRVNQPIERNLLGGTVSYTVQDKTFDGQNLVQIKTVANYFGHTYKATAYTEGTVGKSGPPFFDYAMLSGEKFTVNGEDNRIIDDNNPNWNADTHSNGEMKFDGNNFIQEGFVTYSDNLVYTPGDVTIIPNQNPEGDPVTAKAPVIDIPNFDAENYKSDADVIYNGDKNMSGTIILGTKDNPKIIYVGGELYLEGTIQGYGIFIVKDDVEIIGDVLLDIPDPNGSKLAIYTNKKFMVNTKDVDIHAQVFAMEDVILNEGSIDFYGSLTSKKNVVFNGMQVDLHYKPASTSLIEPFWELLGGGRLAILYYNEQ